MEVHLDLSLLTQEELTKLIGDAYADGFSEGTAAEIKKQKGIYYAPQETKCENEPHTTWCKNKPYILDAYDKL